MKNILVTGGNGQLATCLNDAAKKIDKYNFLYVDRNELDITNKADVENFFKEKGITHCINCAAYTAVDKAEAEIDFANAVNNLGAKHLAAACKRHGAVMIHISTDFVFNGQKGSPYKETDATQPLGAYGLTKLQGELAVAEALREHFIIRTSWLYSEHGNNFLKTMLRLGSERNQLAVVSDQIGSPTYAGDLARVILKIITYDFKQFGIYHYGNEGVASWYDFTKAIFDLGKVHCNVAPIATVEYPTPAKRPAFSVMDKSKIKKALEIQIPYWRESLERCIKVLKP